MMTRILLSTLVISLLALGSLALAQQGSEVIKSKEDIVFHTPDMFKFSDAGKISEFKGVIDRVYFGSSDLKLIDLYQFSSDEVKVSDEICREFIEKIFALSRSKLFKMKYLKIENSNKGNVCEALISDKNVVKEDPYIRFVTVGFVNAKANVLVYHPKSVSDDKISEMKKVWNSLR